MGLALVIVCHRRISPHESAELPTVAGNLLCEDSCHAKLLLPVNDITIRFEEDHVVHICLIRCYPNRPIFILLR
jgi:hypothetical protein